MKSFHEVLNELDANKIVIFVDVDLSAEFYNLDFKTLSEERCRQKTCGNRKLKFYTQGEETKYFLTKRKGKFYHRKTNENLNSQKNFNSLKELLGKSK